MCKHCGAEKTGTGWGEDLYACGMTSGHPADVRTSECLRREVRQIATDRDQLRAELEATRKEYRRLLRMALRDRDKWRASEQIMRDLFTTQGRAALSRTEVER